MSSTVLLVEDEPHLLLLARLILEMSGFAVIEARGGEEAVELAEKEKVEAVFLDLRMPGMDGWAVLEELRARGTIPRLPVIVLCSGRPIRDQAQRRAWSEGIRQEALSSRRSNASVGGCPRAGPRRALNRPQSA